MLSKKIKRLQANAAFKFASTIMDEMQFSIFRRFMKDITKTINLLDELVVGKIQSAIPEYNSIPK